MKTSNRMLLIGTLLILIIMVMVFTTSELDKVDDYQAKIELSNDVNEAFQLIKYEKINRGLNIDNHTSGMLGPEITGLMTTLGSKESKATAANPNFSAVVMDYISQLNLKEGEKIALSLSSSFPTLNIQTIMACEKLGLSPVIVSSIGSSTFGATDPEMTYIDMEYFLYERGIINHKASFVTLGGDYDTGKNMDQEVLKSVVDRLEGLGYEIVVEADYEENLSNRLSVYEGTKALVNVGGNYVAFTEANLGYFDDYGYIRAQGQYNYENKGLIGKFLSTDRDVIHLLNIKDIAMDYGMPIDPQGEILIGDGGVYYNKVYNRTLLWLVVILSIFLILEIYNARKKETHRAIDNIIQQQFED